MPQNTRPALESVVDEVCAQFVTLSREQVAAAVARACDDLAADGPPELQAVSRRARLLLTIDVLDGDTETATALLRPTTLPGVAGVARSAVRSRLACDGVTFIVREGDYCFYADEDSIAPLWAGQRFPMQECVSGWAMVHAEPAVIDDIDRDDRVPLEAYRSTYVRSMLAVPLPGRDHPLAAIGAYWAQTGRAQTADLEWAHRVAVATSALMCAVGDGDAPWAPNFRTALLAQAPTPD